MMTPSSLIIFQFSVVVLLMAALTTSTNIPQPTSMIAEMSQSYDDERNPAAVFPDHHNNLNSLPSSSNHFPLTDDDNSSSEEYDNEYSQSDQLESIWPQIMNKRYADKVIRGDSRLWAIPYRFGKRSAMPYRFGKRAGMHFRLGKKSAIL